MTAKEYLAQAYRIDQRINSKLEQVSSLNGLAIKCNSTLTGMPSNPNPGTFIMADAISKIVALQAEINSDIDILVDLKRDIIRDIKSVDNTEYQTLLEKRYLCFMSWEQIAVDMNYSLQHTFRLHDNALKKIMVPKDESK